MYKHRAARRPVVRLGVLVVACAALPALAGCSLGGNASAKHLEIATLFAVSGADAAMQLPAQYAGVTGDISFDKYGDNSGKVVFSVYQVNGSSGQWSFFQLYQCTGSGSPSCRRIANL